MAGLSKAECASILTALCRKKLLAAGYTVAAFAVGESDVIAALESRMGLPYGDPTGTYTADANTFPAPPPVPDQLVPALEASVVWIEWLKLQGLSYVAIDPKSKAKIEERLAFGFSPQDLVEAFTRAVLDPSLLKRKTLKAISKPLESDRRVCELLGREYVRPKKITWLTPFEELWLAKYPQGEVPFGIMAKVLQPLVNKHGESLVLEELDRYLDATSIAYLSWPKFAQGFGQWSYGAKLGSRSSYAKDALSAL